MVTALKKTFLLISLGLVVWSCKKNAADATPTTAPVAPTAARGKTLFEGEGQCITCHQADQQVIGPSLRQMARVYHDQQGDLLGFLQGQTKPLVDPAQYPAMQVNLERLQSWPQADLEALAAYIRSFE